jgi:acetylornithine deacetylase/succinyl-diaminopimelate desuccinylase family protein
MSTTPDPARLKTDLAALVAYDTQNPPGREDEAAEFVGSLLKSAGFAVTLDRFAPGRANVEARLVNGDGPVFAFNTHLDVVPAGEGWSSDPFRLREEAGRLYGRGACDAKGSMIAMIEAMRLLAEDRGSWRGTLVGIFVADEEVASAGARLYASRAPRIDFAVIGEPTSNGTIVAHKGSLRPIVRVHGVSAHSGTPDLGDNAIYRAAAFAGLVEAQHRDVVRLRTHTLVGSASLTITRISAGVADNMVPDACDLMLDRRMVPGEDEAQVKREIEALLADAASRLGLQADITEYRPTTGGATETAVDHPLVRAALATCRAHGVSDPGPGGFQGACDLVHFRNAGAVGVVIGPGSLALAHKPDEYVPLDELVTASAIYRDLVRAMAPV